MKKILFVCTGNTCRSPMAEGIFNKMAGINNWSALAESAGIMVTETAVSENSLAVCKENGIDISKHISRQLTREMIEDSDVILTMTKSHKMIFDGLSKVFTLSEYVGGEEDVSDPYGGDLEVYRKTFSQLETLIGKYYED